MKPADVVAELHTNYTSLMLTLAWSFALNCLSVSSSRFKAIVSLRLCCFNASKAFVCNTYRSSADCDNITKCVIISKWTILTDVIFININDFILLYYGFLQVLVCFNFSLE